MFSLLKRKWFWMLLLVAFGVVAARSWSRGPSVPQGSFLVLDLEGEYAEGPPRPILAQLLQEEKPYIDLIETLEKAGRDSRLSGLILRIGPLAMGWGQAREVRDAVKGLRVSGKKVVAYLDNEVTSGNLAYYLASSADSVEIEWPDGSVDTYPDVAAGAVVFHH